MKLTADIIQGFVTSILASGFDGQVASPSFHKECWELCTGTSKQVAIAAPRRHAKTTALTVGYGLATLLFRERRYMLIVSDTVGQAEQFLGEFRQALTTNQNLIELFDLKLNEKGEVQFKKDSLDDIVVEFKDGHTFRVQAKGAEQKLRGLIWNGIRPDIILCDDIENDELVMNKERRVKFQRWFYGALLPCMSKTGVIRVFGTILHMDSLLESFMPERQTRGNSRQKIAENHLHETDLKVWSSYKALPWKSVRYRAHNRDFSQILWPENYNEEYFTERYDDFAAQGITDVYSQEFLNTPLDEANTYFSRRDFQKRGDSDRGKALHYYITADLAISQETRADYSVFLVAGMDENRVLHVVNVIRERLDAREIVDLVLHLQNTYEPEAFGIEDMQVSKSIGPFLREEMLRTNIFPNLVLLKHNGKDKIFRARSIQARMRAGGVRFEKDSDWYNEFEDECMKFPRDRHDDQVDAFAYMGLLLNQMIEAPTKEEIEEEEEEKEYAESGLSDGGRSDVTGY